MPWRPWVWLRPGVPPWWWTLTGRRPPIPGRVLWPLWLFRSRDWMICAPVAVGWRCFPTVWRAPGKRPNCWKRWSRAGPAVVFRLGSSLDLPPFLAGIPVIPVWPLFPGFLYPPVNGPAVYQAMLAGPPPKVGGIVLPPLGRSHLIRMLGGRGFPPRRWVNAWARAWSVSWP